MMTDPDVAHSPVASLEASKATDVRALIELAYRSLLGRDIEPDAIVARVAALEEGVAFSDMFVEIATSEEALLRNRTQVREHAQDGNRISATAAASVVDLAYAEHLKRRPNPDEVSHWISQLSSGLAIEEFIECIVESDESREKAGASSDASASSHSTIVDLAYAHHLKRQPSPDEVSHWMSQLSSELSVENFIECIIDSEEARRKAEESSDLSASSHFTIVDLAYAHHLERRPSPDEVSHWMSQLSSGLSIENFIECIVRSQEAQEKSKASSDSSASSHLTMVDLAYAGYLDRQPAPGEISHWMNQLSGGLTVERLIQSIAGSEEARLKSQRSTMSPNLSDGEFMEAASDALFGRGLLPTEVVVWQRRLETSGETRSQIVSAVVDDKIRSSLDAREQPPAAHDPDQCWIMGTARILTRKLWEERARELVFSASPRRDAVPLDERTFNHVGSVDVSMIASLYKGGRYIEKFLENISSQTMFDRSELIIIDADSPEREWETIEAYQKIYSNIVYKRINYRLGIYDAWNVGVELSRGRYLTNTNLDDLRRHDSIALQAALLDAEPGVDVVYQDFYYSLDPELDFEQVAAYAFKSAVPIITPHNLLLFNSPHNAPMWRASLHAELGPFDISYRSAGDYEFWARCMAGGKTFRKINTPHVVYYQNPEGVSTRPDTRGVQEAHQILSRYGKMLTSATLLQSRRDFLAGIGVDTNGVEADDKRPYYEIVQDALYELGTSRPAPACHDVGERSGSQPDQMTAP